MRLDETIFEAHQRRMSNLHEWLRANKKTDAWLAEQIGVSRGYVTNLRHGRRQPSLPLAVKLAGITGLPMQTFEQVAA
jgi:transcriptional regulator with XRE-family HTH domain